MPPRRLIVALALAFVTLGIGSAGEAGSGPTPGASSQAVAVKVTVPGQADVTTPVVASPPNASSFKDSYATTGVSAGAISAGATTRIGNTQAIATAAASVAQLSLFGGEITADAVAASAKAGVTPGGAAGDLSGSSVANLVALGQKVEPSPNLKVPLGDWGTLTVLAQGVDQSAPQGSRGFRGFVGALDVHLNQPHGGLPAGTEIVVGYAEADARSAPPAPATSSTTGTTTLPTPPGTGPGPQFSPGHLTREGRGPKAHKPRFRQPPKVTPKLTAGGYVFPVYGPASYVDTFGAERGDLASGWHHGTDIFGQLGQPILAVAEGTVFSVGWNKIGGNRLWLRDGAGNDFYYAHLSAYSTLAVNGAHVQAGDVIGFMGNTGDAEGTPYHLHFEIHPVSMLFIGYDGAVDPQTYLEAWQKLEDVNFPGGGAWAPLIHGHGGAPEPGAILLQVSDISQADGLDPASLRRALVAERTG
ncbi:MAG TPA: M23 family metallopeptidase [Gaiellaceae bacterium]